MRREGPDERGFCTPECVFFKCAKQAMSFRGNTIWCSWINDNCIGSSCSFSICIMNKLLPGNRCGLVVKRLTRELPAPEHLVDLNVKIPSKVSRRISSDEDLL